MEFKPNTHREDYTKTEKDLDNINSQIDSKKTSEELSDLLDRKKVLEDSLSRQKDISEEYAIAQNKELDEINKKVKELENRKVEIVGDREETVEQDLTGLEKVEFFVDRITLSPSDVLKEKEPTETKVGIHSTDEFKSWMESIAQNREAVARVISTEPFYVNQDMTGQELKDKLKTKSFTVGEFATFIKNQSDLSGDDLKIKTPLRGNGNWNLFLVEKGDGSTVVVRASYGDDRKWFISVRDLTYKWPSGDGVWIFTPKN